MLGTTSPFRLEALFAALAVLILCAPTVYAVDRGDQLTVTARSGLRLRGGSGKGYARLTTLATGSKLVATGRSRSGWVEVKAGAQTGWVKADYVTEGGFCADCQGGRNALADEDENPLISAGRAIAKTVQDAGDAVFNGILNYAKKLSSFFDVGYQAPRDRCWRAVWNTLRAAGLVRGEPTQDYAKNALKDLRKFGFRHDPRACNTPGVVRIYDGARRGHESGLVGDYAGHAEILGEDGRYHHFRASKRPASGMGENRRPLKHCLIVAKK